MSAGVPREPHSPKHVPCRGCGQKIFFAISPLGKLIPIDASSVVYEVASVDGRGVPTMRIREHAWVSHFRTCRKASEFSKTKEGPCPPSTSAPTS